ncbi:MAG: hypothetical protein ACKO39_08275 [Chthoniobacterales bacterium]
MTSKAAAFALMGLGALVLVLLVVPGAPPASPAMATNSAQSGQSSPGQVGLSGSAENVPDGTKTPGAARVRTASGSAARNAAPAGQSGRDREKAMEQLAMRLAKLPPEEALARIAELPDQDSRDTAMLALLGELSGMSSLEIIRRGDVWRFGAGGALAVHLLESGKITAAQAVAMTQQNTDGNRRGELFVRIGAKLASQDPNAAVALGNGLQSWERQRFLEGLANQWAEESPDQARRWISSVSDASTRDALLAGLLQAEVRSNPAAAAASFASMPPSDPSARSRVAMRIASEWASRDTLAAMQWAQSLPGEAERNAASQGIGNVAPVGIGAMLTSGSEGLPVIGNIVPGSPASASGALQTGDTLLAVSDAKGAWVDTRQLSTRDLLGLVRGEPNTQVSLQVRSPGSSATRVITLGRQQIVFRPQSELLRTGE